MSNLTPAESLAQAIGQVSKDASAELWGIGERNLKEIRQSLGELG